MSVGFQTYKPAKIGYYPNSTGIGNPSPSGAIPPQTLYYQPEETENSPPPPKPKINWTKKLARLIGNLGKWAKEFWPEATATFAALLGILLSWKFLLWQKRK